MRERLAGRAAPERKSRAGPASEGGGAAEAGDLAGDGALGGRRHGVGWSGRPGAGCRPSLSGFPRQRGGATARAHNGSVWAAARETGSVICSQDAWGRGQGSSWGGPCRPPQPGRVGTGTVRGLGRLGIWEAQTPGPASCPPSPRAPVAPRLQIPQGGRDPLAEPFGLFTRGRSGGTDSAEERNTHTPHPLSSAPRPASALPDSPWVRKVKFGSTQCLWKTDSVPGAG